MDRASISSALASQRSYGTRDARRHRARAARRSRRSSGVELEFAQKSGEGELVDVILALRGRAQGALINAGAYSHTSLAIRDAFAAAEVPFVELHLTNVYAREPERRHTMLASGAVGVLCGFGPIGYELALRGLVARLEPRG